MGKKLTAKALKETLWNSINMLETGDRDVKTANAIAGSARGIVATARTQLMVSKMCGKKPSASLEREML